MLDYKNKKIVIATGAYPPEVSGQSTFVSNLMKNSPDGMKISVVSYGKEDRKEDNVFIIKRDVFRYLRYFWRLRKEAKGASIIYAQDLVSSGLPAALAKRKENRLIIRLGGDFLWEKMVNEGKIEAPFSRYYDQPKNREEKKYLRIYCYVLARCDKIVFNSQWQKEIYQKVFGLAEDKMAVIKNPFAGLANEKFHNPVDQSDEMIFAGRFIPLKNLKRLIQAFKQAKTDKKLVLIGDGPQKSELVALKQGDDRIIIEDKMDHGSLLERIARCYLFILPSLSEMNPNAALEAFSLNRPVILTRENGLEPELQSKFHLIDPLRTDSIKEAIGYFLQTENYDNFLESKGKLEESYDWPKAMEDHLKVFGAFNVVNIGTDKTLVGGRKLGDAVERHRRYGEYADHLDIIVYADKKENLKEFKISENVVGYPTDSRSKVFFFFDALRVFKEVNKKHRVDLVQCQDPFLPGLVGWWLKVRYGVRLQINFHGDFWDNPSWLKENQLNRFFLLVSRFVAPRADGIRVMSQGQKEKLVRAGIGEKKIRVISTPVDLEKFNRPDLAELKKQEKRKTILHIGRDDKVKDYDTLIKSWSLVNEHFNQGGNDLFFLQIGADKEIRSARERQRGPFLPNMELTGLQNQDKIILNCHLAEIVVLSSTSESFGKVLIEAGACGKPIVATATAGAKEIIENGVNGYLVPVGEAEKMAEKIIYLLENPEIARQMGKKGKEMAKERFGDNTGKIVEFWQDNLNNNL